MRIKKFIIIIFKVSILIFYSTPNDSALEQRRTYITEHIRTCNINEQDSEYYLLPLYAPTNWITIYVDVRAIGIYDANYVFAMTSVILDV